MMKRSTATSLPTGLSAALLLLLAACSGPSGPEIGLEPLGFGHYNSVTFSLSSTSTGSLSTADLGSAKKKDPGYPGFLALTAEGIVTGLGRDTYVASMTTAGDVAIVCRSPGGNLSPGQNIAFVDETADILAPTSETRRNGRDGFRNTADRPLDPTGLDPAVYCANPNWTAEIGYVDYRFATLTLAEEGSSAPSDRREYRCTTSGNGTRVSCDPI